METLILTGKNKRKLDPRISRLSRGTKLRFGVQLSGENSVRATAIGFSKELTPGESLLPSADFGPVCEFNAEGKEKIHKDQPMETAYRQREWSWTEYHGRYNPVERSEIVDVPYKRYPRSQIPPPSVELTIVMPKDDMKYAVTPIVEIGKSLEEDIVHMINLVLEIFGHCAVLTHEIEVISMPQIRRVHWEILPPGTHPWPQIKQKVQDVLDTTNEQKKVVVEYRLETINGYAPEFVAVGHAGFSGYLVFGFPAQDLYVLESIRTGNATYVFAEDWEQLSMKTKAEILHGNLQKDRIIHRKGWDSHIDNLLSPVRNAAKKVTKQNLEDAMKKARPKQRV